VGATRTAYCHVAGLSYVALEKFRLAAKEEFFPFSAARFANDSWVGKNAGRRDRGIGVTGLRGIVIALIIIASGCMPCNLFGGQNDQAPPGNAAQTTAGSPAGDQVELQRRNPRYRINPGDTLSISFPLSPELNEPTAAVQPDGYVNLQSAHSIHIQGMTVPEVEEAVKKAYAGTLHDPIVSVDLIDFQKPNFFVSGQVGKPGQYDLRQETTVSEGIAIAGGLSPTAKTQIFLLHRVSPGWVEVKKFDVSDVFLGKNPNEDPYLAPGDSIFVPEKFITKFRKYLPYSIGTSIASEPTLY
jgi:polysaccharide biosynthesis/export protein